MGRDVLATTVLREQKLKARSMECELCGQLAKYIQSIERTKDLDGVSPEDKANQKGAVMDIRLCNRHHFYAWKDGIILRDIAIVEGVNNIIHPYDQTSAQRAKDEVSRISLMLGI